MSEEEFMAFGAGTLRAAIIDGDLERGSVLAGQSAGLVNDIVSVQTLIERIIADAEAAINRSVALTRSPT